MLKQALLQEREARKKLQEDFDMALKKGSSFEESLRDAETSAAAMAQENTRLRDEVAELSYKCERLT